MRFRRAEPERVIVAVEFLQALTGIGQADALALVLADHARVDTRPVVGHFHEKLVGEDPGSDTDSTAVDALGYRVLDGVFHQRLQEQAGNQGASCLRLNVLLEPQPVLEAYLFNAEIEADGLQFFLQGDFL